MNRALSACLLAAAVALGGCQTGGKRLSVSTVPPAPVRQVDKIDLMLFPPAPLNWNDDPGLDGFQVQVLFWRLDRKLSVTIDGTLEFLLYEGRCGPEDLARRKAFQTWTYKEPELSSFLGRTYVGWAYAMRLGWGRHVPTTRTVTLVARFTPKDGQTCWSLPAQVAMGAT